MTDSAFVKIDRAAKHVTELNELLREKRPFSYVIETNTETRERIARPKKNQPVLNEAASICGDAAHNLRTALDHVYWEKLSPFATSEAERRMLQFPFCERGADLNETIKKRLADRVGPNLVSVLMRLKPYSEAGGNEPLYLIHKVDIADKHRMLIPLADYKILSSPEIRRQVPDFPFGDGNVVTSGRCGDAIWDIPRGAPVGELGIVRAPTMHIFERVIDVPVDVLLNVGALQNRYPLVPTLHAMVNVAKDAVEAIRAA